MSKPKAAADLSDVISKRKDELTIKEGYINLFLRIILMVIAGYLLLTQVFLITQVNGLGMFPAVKDGDLVIGFRLQQEYSKKDVVVYKVNGIRYFGRVIARETDVVTMDDSGTLLVNGTAQGGEILYPTYAREGILYPFRVPEHHIFVLGDYRTQTLDSRDFGPIPMDSVEGKVITILRRRGI